MEITEEQRAKHSKIGKSNVRSAKVHERRIAKLLSEWSGRKFRRRRVEGRGDDVKVVEGVADVIPVEGDIIFAVEAKKGKDFSIDGLMSNPAGARFTEWWHQASYDAELLTKKTNVQRYPMLFFKPHPNWDWVAVPFQVFQQNILRSKDIEPAEYEIRRKCSEVWFPHVHFDAYCWMGPISHNTSRSKQKDKKVMVSLQLSPVVFCRWRDFAAFVDPESIFIQT
jgi:hypothetical protein